MKIGIITYHFAHNFGAVLQCYSLQEFLKRHGYDVEIINFLVDKNINYHLIFTKVDKINQSEKHHLIVSLKELGVGEKEIIFTSTLKPRTLEPVRQLLSK